MSGLETFRNRLLSFDLIEGLFALALKLLCNKH